MERPNLKDYTGTEPFEALDKYKVDLALYHNTNILCADINAKLVGLFPTPNIDDRVINFPSIEWREGMPSVSEDAKEISNPLLAIGIGHGQDVYFLTLAFDCDEGIQFTYSQKRPTCTYQKEFNLGKEVLRIVDRDESPLVTYLKLQRFREGLEYYDKLRTHELPKG